MTTPMGDQPDWQTLVTPEISSANILDQAATTTGTVQSSATPFRIWAFWIRMSVATSAAYVAAILEVVALLEDGSSNQFVDLSCHVTAANQSQHDHIVIPVNGLTPALNAGLYTIKFVTSPSAANVFFRASGGIFFSRP